MKTSVIEVHDLLSVLSVDEVGTQHRTRRLQLPHLLRRKLLRAHQPPAPQNKIKQGRQQHRNLPRPCRPPVQPRPPVLQATNKRTKRRRTKLRMTTVLRSCHSEVGATAKPNAHGT